MLFLIRIVSLVDNISHSRELSGKHGLSLYIETQNHKVLFDLGPDGTFAKNAEKLGIDISAVDTVIISHGHFDHGGGLGSFLKLNDKAKIYIIKSAFQKYYVKIGKILPHYIGLDRKYENDSRFVFTDDCTVIDDELTVFSGVQSHTMNSRIANESLFSKPERHFEPDKFEHEQYLILSEYSNCVLVTGCSHKGIVNILDHYTQKYGYSNRVLTHVIGGFHLFKPVGNKTEDSEFVKKLAEMLNEYDVSFHTCHCTSEYLFHNMAETMGEKLRYLSTGNSLLIQ